MVLLRLILREESVDAGRNVALLIVKEQPPKYASRRLWLALNPKETLSPSVGFGNPGRFHVRRAWRTAATVFETSGPEEVPCRSRATFDPHRNATKRLTRKANPFVQLTRHDLYRQIIPTRKASRAMDSTEGRVLPKMTLERIPAGSGRRRDREPVGTQK